MKSHAMRRDSEGALHKVVRYDGFDGFIVRWTQSCSGCFETEDGHPVGDYPFDEKAKCHLGAGCEECGYRGKVRNEHWVPFDLGAYASHQDRVLSDEAKQVANA